MAGVRVGASSRAAWLVAVCLVAAAAAGCSAQDPPGPGPEGVANPGASSGIPVSVECAGRIDDLIASRVVPRADREYAIGMCEAGR